MVNTLIHTGADTAHLGKRLGRAITRAKGSDTAILRAADLGEVAAKFPVEFKLQIQVLGDGLGVDKQSEQVQTCFLIDPRFNIKVLLDAEFGGETPALILSLFGHFLIAMQKSRFNQVWRMRSIARFNDFWYLVMPESLFTRGEAPSNILGIPLGVWIDFKHLRDTAVTLLELYPDADICLAKTGSYPCEHIWAHFVGLSGGYNPVSWVLRALLNKTVEKVELAADETKPYCVAKKKKGRTFYLTEVGGSRKVTWNDGSRLDAAGRIDPELWDPTGKTKKKEKSQLPKHANTRTLNDNRKFTKRVKGVGVKGGGGGAAAAGSGQGGGAKPNAGGKAKQNMEGAEKRKHAVEKGEGGGSKAQKGGDGKAKKRSPEKRPREEEGGGGKAGEGKRERGLGWKSGPVAARNSRDM